MGLLKGVNLGTKLFQILNPEYQGFGLKYGFVWFDSSNQLRANATQPSDLDSDGSVVGVGIASAAATNLGNLVATTTINRDLLPDTDATKDLGSATKQWAEGYINKVLLNSTATLDGAGAGIVAITGDVTVSGSMTISGTITVGVSGTGLDFYWYGDTADVYMWWDQNYSTDGALLFTGATATPALGFVNTNVTYMAKLATDVLNITATDHANASIVVGTTGGTTNGIDLTWYGKTNGAALTIDAGADTIRIDDMILTFRKTTTDVGSFTVAANNLYYDGKSANDVFNIGHTTITDFQLDGANGYDLLWDGSGDTLLFKDNAVLAFGDDSDITIKWDATDLLIDGHAGNTAIKIGASNQQDIYIYAATATNYIHFNMDDTANAVLFAGVNMTLNDSVIVNLGTGKDLYFAYAGGTNILEWKQTAAGTGSVTYGVDGKGIDHTWYTETASSYFKIDQANDRFVVAAANMCFGDASALRFGTGTTFGGDIAFIYTGGTDILNIGQVASGTGAITIGADNKGIDVTFFGEAASSSLIWDQDGSTDGALVFNDVGLIFNQTNVDYLLDAASDALLLSATDHASAKLTLGAAGGTHGLDFVLQSVTAGDLITFDAAAKTFTLVDVAPVLGANSTNQGYLTLYDGAGGNTPAYILMHSCNGTAYYLFFADDGDLKVHTSAPTATGDGTIIGTQS